MINKETFIEVFKIILIDYDFRLPISWVWIGVNGAFMTGRIEISKGSKELRSVTLSGNPKKLRFPVNVMFVDATGNAAHVLFKGPGQANEVNRLHVDDPPPATPSGSPISFGKA